MHAERVIVETDDKGNLKQMLRLQPNRRFEAIFLDLENQHNQTDRRLRSPHPDLVGSVTFTGDVMDSLPHDGWNLPE